MVSIPSALMLLVIALVGVMSPSRDASVPQSSTVASQSGQELRRNDAGHDAGWRQAVRTEALRPARSSVDKRDPSSERRERSTAVDPAWIPLASSATDASGSAGIVLHARASAVRAPGLPEPSSRAPPIV
jgi:hypothetical protein